MLIKGSRLCGVLISDTDRTDILYTDQRTRILPVYSNLIHQEIVCQDKPVIDNSTY